MMEASLLAGLAISQTRTALAHSMSYPVTAHFDVPHGIACSFTLPSILAFNAASDDGRLQEAARALRFEDIDALGRALSELLRKTAVRGVLTGLVPALSQLPSLEN
jgi:alcohol dehydrogenase